MDYLLVEREREYVAIARARLSLDEGEQPRRQASFLPDVV